MSIRSSRRPIKLDFAEGIWSDDEQMKAARIHRFGAPQVIVLDDTPRPKPAADEVLIRVEAACVGTRDALVRSGAAETRTLPLILGSELAGIVESVGSGVEQCKPGAEVFGLAGDGFSGAYAEYALARPALISEKPARLNFAHAASVPLDAITAWQMVFDCARLAPAQSVLIHDAAEGIGAFAVQFARRAGAVVMATAPAKDSAYARSLGAVGVIDHRAHRFEEKIKAVDAVIDTAGGEIRERSYAVLKPGGVLVTAAPGTFTPPAAERRVRVLHVTAQVTGERLRDLARMIDAGEIKTEVGEVLWLEESRAAHEMLEGAPHRRGKIVIKCNYRKE